MNPLVLIVDDDEHIREVLRLTLESENFQIETANDGVEALEKFNNLNPDLVVLDVMLPGQNGWEVCRQIRKFSDKPIVMLTAKGEELDRVLGLELGADDYVIKPFSPRELMARIKAILRRVSPGNSTQSIIRFQDLTINLQGHEVKIGQVNVSLTPKEFELLSFMAQNPGRVFTRDQLLSNVWGYEYLGDARTVDEHIKRLRQKVDVHTNVRYLKTIWGLGYKFEVNPG